MSLTTVVFGPLAVALLLMLLGLILDILGTRFRGAGPRPTNTSRGRASRGFQDQGGPPKSTIWDEIEEREFVFPEGKDRILASYETGDVQAYYVEPMGVGDILPEMPLFLTNGWQVPVPLESTYQATWNTSPEDFRLAVETGVMPDLDAE